MKARQFAIVCALAVAHLFTGHFARAVPAEGHEIMIAGPSPAAVEVGRAVHLRGGNVYDVAVAVGLSLAVTHPYYAALGGGGFAVIKAKDGVKALDFREMAPAKASPETFKDLPSGASITGGLAIGVPGVPAGLFAIHEKYGKLPWKSLFQEVLALSDKGFRVSGEWVRNTEHNHDRFNKEAREIFFDKKGNPLRPGDLLKQAKLTQFMKAYQAKGPKAFYEGKTAKDLAAFVTKAGGLITEKDLANYKVRWLQPIKTSYEGYDVYLMPPPSSGGVVIGEALQLIQKLKLKEKAALSVDEFHTLAEVEKLSYRGRALLGDPDFNKNPIEQMMSEKYLSSLAKRFDPNKSLNVEGMKEINFEKEETTHFSVMDAQGNAVALTVTLNGDYGSGLVDPGTGIALNNEMDDFTTHLGKPNMFGLIQGAANQVRAGARPLSSMSPTIVEKNGRTVIAVGSPGGPRIISAVMQVLYRSLSQPFDIDQAIQAPRVHHQFLPNILFTDRLRLSPEIVEGLKKKGHIVDTGSTAKVYGVRLDQNGILTGAFDLRGEGAAGGI